MYRAFASLAAAALFVCAATPAVRAQDAPWLSELVNRIDVESTASQVLAELPAGAAQADSIRVLAGYFRSKQPPERLWVINWPGERQADFVDDRADKAVGHLITDRQGEEQYGDDLPWYSGEKLLSTLSRFPHFDYLAPSYYHTGDERYAAALVRDMLDFVEHVPIEKADMYHVQVDLRINPWNWVLLQWRVKRWVDVLYYLRDSPSLSDEDYLRILLHIQRETEWVVPRKVLGLHNGTLGNLTAILYVATAFPEFASAADWYQEAAAFYLAFLDTAFYPGEFLVELTVGYSEGTLLLCLDIFDRLQHDALREQAAAKLERLVDAHVGIMKPNRSLPRYGDHGAYDIRDRLLRKSATLFGRPDLALLADDPERVDAKIAMRSFPPESDPYFLSGYYAMRDGWSESANYLSMDAGPYGTNHHHGDKLSITVSGDGAEFIVDPGTSLYTSINPGPRIDLRPGYHHNVVTVDGVDVNTGWDRHYGFDVLDNRWVTNPTYDFLEGVYEFRNSLVDVIWRRSVFFRKGEYWIIVDALHGDGEHVIESNLQFMIDVTLEDSADGFLATANNGARLDVQRLESSSLDAEVVTGDLEPSPSTFLYQYPTFVDWTRGGRGWVGTFGNESPYAATRSHPAPALVHSGSIELPHYAVTVLTPSRDGALAPPVARLVGGDRDAPGRFSVELSFDDGRTDVLEWRGVEWSDRWRALPKDSAVWLRIYDDRPEEIVMLNASSVGETLVARGLDISFDAPFEGVLRRSPGSESGWSLYGDTILDVLPTVRHFLVGGAAAAQAGQTVRGRPGEWVDLNGEER